MSILQQGANPIDNGKTRMLLNLIESGRWHR
jgi:predicted P-loop ATPase/GTPase